MRKTAILFLTLILSLFALNGGAVVRASEISANEYTYALRGSILTVHNPIPHTIRSALEKHSEIRTIHLLGELPSPEDLMELMKERPDVTFHWSFDVLGVQTSTTAEALDLSGIPMDSTDAIEAVLPRFYGLKKVIMCGCGLTNEEMDALNRRYPDTEFVWTVKISGFRLRTDAKFLMPFLYGYKLYDHDLSALKYCTQLECIDFGHMKISNCAVLENMPNLRYLIIADTAVSDLTPLGTLNKLEFLEVFLTSATDLGPLINCSSLKDLNISWTPVQDFTPLLHMSQLDRLWMGGCYTSAAVRRDLSSALPNTAIVFHSNASTNKGWRFAPNYYRQRDILGMHYMFT